MPAPKPPAATVFQWLRANLGPRCLAPLTSQDAYALKAAVQIVELYAYDRCEDVALSFGDIVRRIQPGIRYLAYHAIAHVMDWGHRAELWDRAGLDPLPPNIPRCKFESPPPGASYAPR